VDEIVATQASQAIVELKEQRHALREELRILRRTFRIERALAQYSRTGARSRWLTLLGGAAQPRFLTARPEGPRCLGGRPGLKLPELPPLLPLLLRAWHPRQARCAKDGPVRLGVIHAGTPTTCPLPRHHRPRQETPILRTQGFAECSLRLLQLALHLRRRCCLRTSGS
jgi:hypothetical protein